MKNEFGPSKKEAKFFLEVGPMASRAVSALVFRLFLLVAGIAWCFLLWPPFVLRPSDAILVLMVTLMHHHHSVFETL